MQKVLQDILTLAVKEVAKDIAKQAIKEAVETAYRKVRERPTAGSTVVDDCRVIRKVER